MRPLGVLPAGMMELRVHEATVRAQFSKEMESKRTGLAAVLRKSTPAPSSKVYCTTSTKELLSTSERCLAYVGPMSVFIMTQGAAPLGGTRDTGGADRWQHIECSRMVSTVPPRVCCC
jgi:hypothetical protein